MPEITISTDAAPDPNATPPANISGDANKVQVDPNKPAGDPPTPKLILGKYKTQADLEKAHVELEKKLGEQKPVVTPEQAREAVTKAGIDMAAISQEYIAGKGTLSEATLKAIEAKGITREQVGAYIDGLKAQSTQMRQEFAQLAGSEEALKSVLEWAATDGDTAVVKAYNEAVDRGDVVVAKIALQTLGNSYNEAVGSDPALLNGDLTAGDGVEAFASSAQIIEAMRNPKYETDPAYRAGVERRLAKFNGFSIRSGSK
jgi:capsid assembly protein